MMNWHDTWSWGDWLAMGVSMLFMWSLVVVAVVVLVWALHDRNAEGMSSGRDARRILDRRFASGEITEDEYTRRRQLIHTS